MSIKRNYRPHKFYCPRQKCRRLPSEPGWVMIQLFNGSYPNQFIHSLLVVNLAYKLALRWRARLIIWQSHLIFISIGPWGWDKFYLPRWILQTMTLPVRHFNERSISSIIDNVCAWCSHYCYTKCCGKRDMYTLFYYIRINENSFLHRSTAALL